MRLGGLLSSWALGGAGFHFCMVRFVVAKRVYLGKGESEGRLQPDDTEDEGMSGRHKTAEGWSPPDCCGEGKGSGGGGGGGGKTLLVSRRVGCRV